MKIKKILNQMRRDFTAGLNVSTAGLNVSTAGLRRSATDMTMLSSIEM